MRILIVEDETRLAETLRQLMEDQRYQAGHGRRRSGWR